MAYYTNKGKTLIDDNKETQLSTTKIVLKDEKSQIKLVVNEDEFLTHSSRLKEMCELNADEWSKILDCSAVSWNRYKYKQDKLSAKFVERVFNAITNEQIVQKIKQCEDTIKYFNKLRHLKEHNVKVSKHK